MENPTARETTQATSPAPYPMMVPSSTSAALAARGAKAVTMAAMAALLGAKSLEASSRGAWLMERAALKAGRATLAAGGAKAMAEAARAKRVTIWKVFILL